MKPDPFFVDENMKPVRRHFENEVSAWSLDRSRAGFKVGKIRSTNDVCKSCQIDRQLAIDLCAITSLVRHQILILEIRVADQNNPAGPGNAAWVAIRSKSCRVGLRCAFETAAQNVWRLLGVQAKRTLGASPLPGSATCREEASGCPAINFSMVARKKIVTKDH
jgi:hypothetical protein